MLVRHEFHCRPCEAHQQCIRIGSVPTHRWTSHRPPSTVTVHRKRPFSGCHKHAMGYMSQENITEVGYLGDHVGSSVTILGWVESTRSHGKVGFVIIRDGTGLVQGVLLKKELPADAWALLESLTDESSVALSGEVREEPRAPGGYEVGVTGLELLGASEEYPIQPKEHGVEFLLDHRHLWLRSSLQRAGLRVRHEVEQAIHDYFYERDFVRIDTPILTGSIGESAGTLFETDYFGETAFLAQTGQLYVETACPAFRKVYCFGPTFRAEKSKTRRHLTTLPRSTLACVASGLSSAAGLPGSARGSSKGSSGKARPSLSSMCRKNRARHWSIACPMHRSSRSTSNATSPIARTTAQRSLRSSNSWAAAMHSSTMHQPFTLHRLPTSTKWPGTISSAAT